MVPREEGPASWGWSLPETRVGFPVEEKDIGVLVEIEARPRTWVTSPPRSLPVRESAREIREGVGLRGERPEVRRTVKMEKEA